MNIIGIELKNNCEVNLELATEDKVTVELILNSCKVINNLMLNMVPHGMQFDYDYQARFTDFSEDLNKYTAVWIINDDFSIKCRL